MDHKKKCFGRKPKVDKNKLQNILYSYGSELFLNGVLNFKSPLWALIEKQLGNCMKAISIYLIVKQDRDHLLSNLKKNIGMESVVHHESYNNSSDVETSSSVGSEVEDQTVLTVKTFDLDLPYDVYRKIKPLEVEYGTHKKRKYFVLPPGVWTNIIFDAFYSAYSLPCCYAFKRCKVYNDPFANHFLEFHAICKEDSCKSILKGIAYKKPLEDEVLKIKITTTDTRDKSHSIHLKRHLNGEKRKEIGRNLQQNYVNLWRRNEMRKNCKFGEVEPPNIYGGNALRKNKQEYRDKLLDITENNPIMSLIELKHTVPYAGSIHTISADPFMVHYWSQYQTILCKTSKKRSSECFRLCIDATGSVVKKILRTSKDLASAHIFLYTAVLNDGQVQVPVSQMLSEAQDLPTIVYWLSQWVRSGAPIPNEVVVDYSNALIGAVTRSFAEGLSKLQYCEQSLLLLQNGKEKARVPKVYVRLDIAHFIKMVCRWKCFQNKTRQKIKEFYVRAIIVLAKCETLDSFQETFMKILVVACSEYDGSIKGSSDSTYSEIYREDLLKRIENMNPREYGSHSPIHEDNEETNDIDFEDNEVITSNNENIIGIFINNLTKKVKQLSVVEGNRINAFYVPELYSSLLYIAKDFPLWSNVMLKFYNTAFVTATSAPVESYFADMKKELRRSIMSVDRFVASHLKSIEGIIKLARSNQIKTYPEVEEESLAAVDLRNQRSNQKNTKPQSSILNGDLFELSSDDDNIYNQIKTYSDENIMIPGDLGHTQFLNTWDIRNLKQQTCSLNNEKKRSDEDENPCLSIEKNLYSIEDKNVQSQVENCLGSPNSDLNKDENKLHFELQEIENWKNKADKPTKLNRPTKYKDGCTEIRRVLNTSGLRSTRRAIISNGNICSAIKINKICTLVYNTCAFDSLLAAISVGYVENNNFKKYLDSYTVFNEFLSLCKIIATHGTNRSVYKQRGELLFKTGLFKHEIFETGVSILNANVNVVGLSYKILKDVPTYTQHIKCTNCLYTQSFSGVSLILNELRKNGLRHLEDLTMKDIQKTKKMCSKCKMQSKESSKELKGHLLIETDAYSNNEVHEIKLSDIPDKIQADNKKYLLQAIIVFVESKISFQESGHYYAICKRSKGYMEVHDDLLNERKIIKNIHKEMINPHILFYLKE